MKVLFQYQGLISEEYKQFFSNNVPDGVELIFSETREEVELLEKASEVEIFVGYRISEAFIQQAKKLRHIQIPWTGFNNFGGEHLEGRDDITVSNSHSNSLAIAEHAIALLFAASKLLTHRDSLMRKGDWSTRSNDTESFWLTGRKLGIIGYGAIGKKVAAMLKPGFNMEVLAIKRNKSEKDEITDFIGDMQDLDYVLSESDLIVVAVPLTSETEGLLKKEHFAKMKNNAVLVNIARGPVVEEEALYTALKEKQIGAAGIDVWYNYPSGGTHETQQNFPFHDLPNIVMTPHSAFKVRDREEVFAQDILENIIRVYENKEPINKVHLDLGY
ncbi:MAG: hypothetical protein INQ03_25995 [Candidatus Heimdallarchaeota archaeon]|nr:hypothetical protein [Candidatus Heimdallarchaeota archaeon]